MTTSVQAIPAGFHSVTPYLTVSDATRAIEFYSVVFGAVETTRLVTTDGNVMHAVIMIGDSPIMLCDEYPDWNSVSPARLGGTPVSLMLYVENADVIVEKAVTAGAVLQMPVENQFWGDRCGTILDPFGHKWTIATHIEDVPNEEIASRAREMFALSCCKGEC